MPLYSGRIRASSFFNGPSEYDDGQPTRCAITGVGIVGHSRSSARICGSYASTTDPRVARRYSGGRSDANAARTVFLATPSPRAISLIGTPSARCRRRISAQSSTFSTLQDSGGGQLSEYPGGSVFRIRRQLWPLSRGHGLAHAEGAATPPLERGERRMLSMRDTTGACVVATDRAL